MVTNSNATFSLSITLRTNYQPINHGATRASEGFNVGMVQFNGLRHPFGISKKLLGIVSKYCYACN